MTLDMTRRHIMMALGGGAIAASGLSPAMAPPTNRNNILLLTDNSLPDDLKARLSSVTDSEVIVPLEGDLVWQWRRGLRAQVKAHAGGTVALVQWDKLMVLEGLAREDRMPTTSERLARNIFRVEL